MIFINCVNLRNSSEYKEFNYTFVEIFKKYIINLIVP